jgi:phosphate transport system permease protein
MDPTEHTTGGPVHSGAATAVRPRTPRTIVEEPTRVDRAFTTVTTAAALTVLALLGLIAVFLVVRSRPALQSQGWSFFTEVAWRPDDTPPVFGSLGLLTGTITVGLIAVAIAIPLGVCAALFITEYAPLRWRGALTSLIDLLAAIPSLLYGIWGFLFLSAQIAPLSAFLNRHLSFVPIFRVQENALFVNSMFIAGIVVSLMVLPIIAAVSRAVFAQTPSGEKEAALALGGTRWGMIRTVVLPYGKGGIIGGSMLGLGRALGETIAVSLLLPQVPSLSFWVLQNGGSTISGFIARRAGSNAFQTSGLMAAGLVLFALTLATNSVASVVIARSRSGQGVDS